MNGNELYETVRLCFTAQHGGGNVMSYWHELPHTTQRTWDQIAEKVTAELRSPQSVSIGIADSISDDDLVEWAYLQSPSVLKRLYRLLNAMGHRV